MSAKFVKLDMNTINGGAVKDLFDRGLAQLLDNIGDPNTDAEAVRKIVVTFEVKPTKDREAGATRLSLDVKTAKIKSVDGTVVFDHDGAGKIDAYTSMVKEQELPLEGGANKTEEVKTE